MITLPLPFVYAETRHDHLKMPTPEVNIAARLIVDGRSIALGQVCRDSLVLAEPCELPPTDAQLIVTVSGQDKVYNIFLLSSARSQPQRRGGQLLLGTEQ